MTIYPRSKQSLNVISVFCRIWKDPDIDNIIRTNTRTFGIHTYRNRSQLCDRWTKMWGVVYWCRGLCGSLRSLVKALSGPKYSGKYLHKLVRELLGEIRLHQALTNVVIPTFDIKNLQPVLFSSFKVCTTSILLYATNLILVMIIII